MASLISLFAAEMAEKFTMISGDFCDLAGYYWASGCGHPDVAFFLVNTEFPVCKTCGRPVNWVHQESAEIPEAPGPSDRPSADTNG